MPGINSNLEYYTEPVDAKREINTPTQRLALALVLTFTIWAMFVV